MPLDEAFAVADPAADFADLTALRLGPDRPAPGGRRGREVAGRRQPGAAGPVVDDRAGPAGPRRTRRSPGRAAEPGRCADPAAEAAAVGDPRRRARAARAGALPGSVGSDQQVGRSPQRFVAQAVRGPHPGLRDLRRRVAGPRPGREVVGRTAVGGGPDSARRCGVQGGDRGECRGRGRCGWDRSRFPRRLLGARPWLRQTVGLPARQGPSRDRGSRCGERRRSGRDRGLGQLADLWRPPGAGADRVHVPRRTPRARPPRARRRPRPRPATDHTVSQALDPGPVLEADVALRAPDQGRRPASASRRLRTEEGCRSLERPRLRLGADQLQGVLVLRLVAEPHGPARQSGSGVRPDDLGREERRLRDAGHSALSRARPCWASTSPTWARSPT